MTQRIVSVGDDFTLPPSVKAADANLPATSNAAAIAAKLDASQKGAASGVATLDSGAKIPAGQVPDLSATYVKYVAAPTGVAATDTANIQAALTAIPSTGGTIVLQGGIYNLNATLTCTQVGVTIIGQGGTAQGTGLTWGATRLLAAASGWALIVGTAGSGNASYGGPTLQNLQIVGNATAAGGVWLKGQSNFRIRDVTVSGFTAGIGLNCDNAGSNSQYGELIGFQGSDCRIGLQVNGSNGLRVMGGMFDGNHNSGSIRAGSTAIQVTSGDTIRLIGTVIQFYETGVDLAVGINSELHGCRFEAFVTAVKNAAPSTRIYGGSFNNSIIGLSGTALVNTGASCWFEPGDITQVTTALTDTVAGVRTPTRTGYAPFPSGSDDQPALQALLNNVGANGGIVTLHAGTYLLNSNLNVPNKVVLRGQGRTITTLKAGPTFAVGSKLVTLGPLATGYAFNTRLEELAVDCNGVATSTAVYAERLQEKSGVFGCILMNFTQHGIWLEGIGNADMGVANCEIYPATGATYGIYYNASAGSNFLKDSTIGVQGTLTAGVWAKSATLQAYSLHIEAATDGIVWEASSGFIHGISGPTTANNVTNLVRMLGSSRYVVATGITKNSCPTAVKDEFFSRTITDSFVPLWVGGDAYIARFNHNGDKLGFFGTTQTTRQAIAGPKGSYAANVSLVTALAAYGLVTDSTTTPLVTKTTGYTITASDRFIISNGVGLTHTLPDPTTVTAGQQMFVVKNINASTCTVVSAGTTKTLDGAASQSLAQWAKASYVSDGSQWLTVA